MGVSRRRRAAGISEFKRLERPGERITWGYERKTNYFNSLENAADHVHANFVHARSAFSTIGVNREIPEIEPWETDFGIAFNTKYKEGKNGRHYVVMPLAIFIMIAEEGLDKLVDHLAFRIPIDDYSHRAFIVNLFEIFGEERDRYHGETARAPRGDGRACPLMTTSCNPSFAVKSTSTKFPIAPISVGIQDSVVMETQPPSAIASPTSSAVPTAPRSCCGASTRVRSRLSRRQAAQTLDLSRRSRSRPGRLRFL